MRSRRIFAVFFAALLFAACVSSEDVPTDDDTWVGTITTEGNVTTVVNESGSVWGGTATLVEEASIGVDAGDPAYMLGAVNSLTATEDRIYVLDYRPPMVRVYDMQGAHLFDIGREGQGPGEFDNPMSAIIDAGGRLLVRDGGNHRMTVFSLDGELLDSWALPGTFSTSTESVPTGDGTVYVPASLGRDPDSRQSIIGRTPYAPDGTAGEPIAPPEVDFPDGRLPAIEMTSPGGGTRTTWMTIPFWPRPSVEFSPAGAWVLGVGDTYRFEIRHLDGRSTIVERVAPPITISSREADWQRERTTARARGMDPDWSWSGPGVPGQKPFFTGLYPDLSGRVWAVRRGPSTFYEDCSQAPGSSPPEPGEEPEPCWRSESIVDLFDADGRYLGEVAFPRGYGPAGGFIRDELLLLPGIDEVGTFVVKRYRLVLPEAQEQ